VAVIEESSKRGPLEGLTLVDSTEKFYEGASWLAQQSVAEGEEALRRLEALRQDFRKRVTETGCSDAFMRERLAEWVLDSSERIFKEAKDKAE
jgi:hypothetical protein